MSQAVAGSHAPEIEPEWIWTLQASSQLLAVGSVFLLGASVLIVGADAIVAAAGPWSFLAYVCVVPGVILLNVLGSIGLSVHLWSLAGSSFPLWAFFLPGLTCFGYGLTAWALQQEYEQHRVRLGPQTNWPLRS